MIRIYTDGACSHNGSWQGGWGVVAVKDGVAFHEEGGSELETTNNRMEMQAFLRGLELGASYVDDFVIVTDSAYVMNAFTQGWIKNWEKNGWKNAKKQPVANQDLWQKIIQFPTPKIEKVKGHSGDEFNDKADAIAVFWRDKK